MNRTDFLAGRPFKYKGHFQTLRRHELAYDRVYGCVNDNTANTWWPVFELSDDHFMLFTPRYGKIFVPFAECTPIDLTEPITTH